MDIKKEDTCFVNVAATDQNELSDFVNYKIKGECVDQSHSISKDIKEECVEVKEEWNDELYNDECELKEENIEAFDKSDGKGLH